MTSVTPSYRTDLWLATLICTCFFLVMHFISSYVIVNITEDGVDPVLLTWSAVQIAIALYSLILLMGTIAFKVVLLYGKLVVRIVIVFYMSISFVMILLSFTIAFTADSGEAQINAYYSLLYQLALNGPTIVMMGPLFYFISELEDYLSTYYSNVSSSRAVN